MERRFSPLMAVMQAALRAERASLLELGSLLFSHYSRLGS